MKTGPSWSSLNLSTLLSFNELAWIAFSAMALFCGYMLSQQAGPGPEPDPVEYWKRQALHWSNETVRVTLVCHSVSNQLSTAKADLTKVRTELVDAQKQVRSLATSLAEAKRDLEEANQRLRDAIARITLLESDLVAAKQENADLSRKLKENEDAQEALRRQVEFCRLIHTNNNYFPPALGAGQVHQELLGLRGSMTNVVILLDHSASMNEHGRWDDSLRTIETWLTYLPIQNCALITFGGDVVSYPKDGGFLPVGGTNESARISRAELLRQVRGRRPAGNTAMVRALRDAYAHPQADTIILFSDGEPYDPTAQTGLESKNKAVDRFVVATRQTQEALDLTLKHKDRGIPINVVALGDYSEELRLRFLLQMVKNSEGSFLGWR